MEILDLGLETGLRPIDAVRKHLAQAVDRLAFPGAHPGSSTCGCQGIISGLQSVPFSSIALSMTMNFRIAAMMGKRCSDPTCSSGV